MISKLSEWKKLLFNLKQTEHKEALIQKATKTYALAKYADLVNPSGNDFSIQDYEFSVYSQNGEDGILLELFDRIHIDNYTLVEFGIGTGKECNSANLLLHFGWSGLLMDCDETGIQKAKARFDEKHKLVESGRLRIKKALIDADNINPLLESENLPNDLDFLSIDIDGNDYWVWKAITCIKPRLIAIEYNGSFGLQSISVAYDPTFDRLRKHPSGFYHGASLKAFESLGKSKGYRLIGCDSEGVNAFFLREDIAVETIPTRTAEECFEPNKKRSRKLSTEQQFNLIKHLPLVMII
ncbi:MAG: hypothetical protein AAFW89_15135 [Bacteroidota bacterium]